MEKKLPPVIPPTLSSLVTGGGQREANAAYGETAGEFIGLGKAPTAIAKGVVKGAKVLTPTAKQMAERIAGKVGNSFRNYVVPYENAPDNLMGFPKDKPTKSFWDQKYSHVQFVRVKWADGQEIVDAVKGVNGPHAMERARRNWKDAAEIVPLTREDAFKADPELQTLMESMGAEKVVDATGGRMRAVPDGGGAMPKPDISRIPGAADADKAINEIERLSEQHGTVFIRWSRGPEYDLKTGASSRDFVSGQQHDGISAIPIGSDMHPVDIARRLAEYGFLRMKDNHIRPFVYVGERIGTDSDGYALIRPTKKVAELSDATILAIDKGYAHAADLRDEIETLESRSSLAHGHAKQIIERDLVTAKQKLADLLKKAAQ